MTNKNALDDVLSRYPQGGAIPCTADLGTFMIPSGDFLALLNFARDRTSLSQPANKMMLDALNKVRDEIDETVKRGIMPIRSVYVGYFADDADNNINDVLARVAFFVFSGL